METPDFTPKQAEHVADLVNNKISPACHYLECVTRGEEPPKELAGLSLAALNSLSGQINALCRQAGIEMLEVKHV